MIRKGRELDKMGTYYIAGFPVSDELYHHGIKGQKWGIRRYQNEDGTLTSAGKARYGKGLGEYASKKQGIVRKLVTGDHILGRKRWGEMLENHYEKQVKKSKEAGRNEEANNYSSLLKAQRQRNIDREKYLSNTSTGKIAVQNLLLGAGADSYRVERQNQTERGKAATSAILAYVGDAAFGMGRITGFAGDAYKSKQRYGRVTL